MKIKCNPSNTGNIFYLDFNLQELKEAISGLKMHKSLGPDNVSAGMIKHLGMKALGV
jgi:hypothetical protein